MSSSSPPLLLCFSTLIQILILFKTGFFLKLSAFVTVLLCSECTGLQSGCVQNKLRSSIKAVIDLKLLVPKTFCFKKRGFESPTVFWKWPLNRKLAICHYFCTVNVKVKVYCWHSALGENAHKMQNKLGLSWAKLSQNWD